MLSQVQSVALCRDPAAIEIFILTMQIINAYNEVKKCGNMGAPDGEAIAAIGEGQHWARAIRMLTK